MGVFIILIILIIIVNKKNNEINGKWKNNNLGNNLNSTKNICEDVELYTRDKIQVLLRVKFTIFLKDSNKFSIILPELKKSIKDTIKKVYSGKSIKELKELEINQVILKTELKERLGVYKDDLGIGVIKVEYIDKKETLNNNSSFSTSTGNSKPQNSIFESSVSFGDYKNNYSDVECIHTDDNSAVKINKKKYKNFFEDVFDNPIKEKDNKNKFYDFDSDEVDPIKNK